MVLVRIMDHRPVVVRCAVQMMEAVVWAAAVAVVLRTAGEEGVAVVLPEVSVVAINNVQGEEIFILAHIFFRARHPCAYLNVNRKITDQRATENAFPSSSPTQFHLRPTHTTVLNNVCNFSQYLVSKITQA
jgi:hypothetical protein